MDKLVYILLIPVLIISVIIHENAHGLMALFLGDETAKKAGRLSFNPIKHIDPFGSILLPLILAFLNFPIIGYAKPVPINPMYFKDQRKGMMWTSLAGPLSNFLLAFLAVVLYKIAFFGALIKVTLYLLIEINIILGVFNLLPIPPLDGSKIVAGFIPQSMLKSYYRIEYYSERYIFIVLLILILFPNVLAKPFSYVQIFISKLLS